MIMKTTFVTLDDQHLDAVYQYQAMSGTPRALEPRALVVMAHGIMSDLNEFKPLADALAAEGCDSLAITFRGHGKSSGRQEGMTIAGLILDFQAAMEYAVQHVTPLERAVQHVKPSVPIFVLGSSFGAVPSLLCLNRFRRHISGVVLWNPVLDMTSTFLMPKLPWAQRNLTADAYASLDKRGYILLDDKFRLGWIAIQEMPRYRPFDAFVNSSLPSLVVHGDQDTEVSYPIAEQAVAAVHDRECTLATIKGADHGFPGAYQQEAIDITLQWIVSHLSGV